MRDISFDVDAGTEPLCPLCDNPILFEPAEIVSTHGTHCLAHTDCVDDAYEEHEREE